MKSLLAVTFACVVGAVAIQRTEAALTWYDAGVSQATLQADLGGTVTVYGFEDQTVTPGGNGGEPGNYLGNGSLPTYGFTWTTNPSGPTTIGWAPDDLTGYVVHANAGNNWGTGPVVGASGKLLINTTTSFSQALVPIGVTFGTGFTGAGSLFAGSGTFTVNAYDTHGTLLGSHDYTCPGLTDTQITDAGYTVADYSNNGNPVLYWGVTSDSANIGGFTFSNARWIIMDNMMTVVPEPASLVLLVFGAAGVLLRRRKLAA